MQEIDLKQIERNVWRDYFQDGLAGMLLGAYLLMVGLFLVGDNAAFVVFPILFYAPLLQALKRKRSCTPRSTSASSRPQSGCLMWRGTMPVPTSSSSH
jgi:hypothetical protein